MPAIGPGPAAQLDYPGTAEGTRALVSRFVVGEHHPEVWRALKPNLADCEAVFEGVVARKAAIFYERHFSRTGTRQPTRLEPAEREIEIQSLTTDDIWRSRGAGGNRNIVAHLKPGLTFYEFTFWRPDRCHGTKYSYLAFVNGHWRFFPIWWRVLESRDSEVEAKSTAARTDDRRGRAARRPPP